MVTKGIVRLVLVGSALHMVTKGIVRLALVGSAIHMGERDVPFHTAHSVYRHRVVRIEYPSQRNVHVKAERPTAQTMKGTGTKRERARESESERTRERERNETTYKRNDQRWE